MSLGRRRRNPRHSGSHLRRSLAQAVGVCFGIILMLGVNVAIADDPFPALSCLESNVAFWQKIYSEYSSNQGVLHDSRRLDIVYEVIDLADQFGPGGRKINRARVNAARNRYKTILATLARGKIPTTPEEKRVAALFGAEAGAADFRQATYRIRCQVGQKDRFRAGLIRSGAYIEEIKAIFREHGLPEDLAYLPHVESSYNPKAYSKFGAAGIWQFTRSTGRRYMAVGYAVDERRDPIYSSHAAASLLKDNYEKLHDWPLAITAYNHGLTGMLRALRRKGSYEAIFQEYRSRIFRFASRNFYSEFLAAREVAKNCHQYFGDMSLDEPQNSREVVLAGYADLRDIADYLQVELDHLQNLNPALREPVFRGQKYVPQGYRLRLPVTADLALAADLPDRVYAHEQKPSCFYRVRSGDTAAKIARMHGVKLKDLIAANSLDRLATVYVSQNLRIPAPGETAPVLASADLRVKPQGTNSGLLSDSDRERNRTAESADAESPTDDPRTDGVEAGADIMSAAEPALSTDPADTVLEESSDVAPQDADSDSEELAVSVAGEKELDGASAAESTSKGLPVPEVVVGHLLVDKVYRRNDRTIGIIQVEVEETLGHYAEWLDVPTAEIRRLNGFPFGRPLRISERIKVPLHKVSKEKFEERRYEYHKELAEDFLGAYRVEEVRIYRIKKGDNIWTLARQQFEVPLWLIRQFNAEVDFGALIPSQELRVPIVAKNA
jgi:peptidoglycan lytic transglycosylase D